MSREFMILCDIAELCLIYIYEYIILYMEYYNDNIYIL